MLSRRVQRIDALRGDRAERGHPGGAAKSRAEVFRRPDAGESVPQQVEILGKGGAGFGTMPAFFWMELSHELFVRR